jgi:hypothetical protein
MELETSILLHVDPEVILWDWHDLVDLSRGMTGAELVGACQEAKMRWMCNILLLSSPGVFDQDGSLSSQVATLLLGYVKTSIHTVKPLLSDPSALYPCRIFGGKGKQ